MPRYHNRPMKNKRTETFSVMEDLKEKCIGQSFHLAPSNYVPHRNDEDAESSTALCWICKDVVPPGAEVRVKFCFHRSCRDCFGPYIGKKLQDNISSVKCPGTFCEVVLYPYFCRPFIPEEVFLRWTNEVEIANLLEVARHPSRDRGKKTKKMAKIPSLNRPSLIGSSSQQYAKYPQLEAAPNALSSSSRTQAPSTSSSIAKCPEPKTSPEACDRLLQALIRAWGDSYLKRAILELESQSFNCPYSDCSASLIADGWGTLMECRKCRRKVCSRCKVPWHDRMNCKEFQSKKVEFESKGKRHLSETKMNLRASKRS